VTVPPVYGYGMAYRIIKLKKRVFLLALEAV